MLLDHQVAHIYKYMGQNIPNILGLFGLKKFINRYIYCLNSFLRLKFDFKQKSIHVNFQKNYS